MRDSCWPERVDGVVIVDIAEYPSVGVVLPGRGSGIVVVAQRDVEQLGHERRQLRPVVAPVEPVVLVVVVEGRVAVGRPFAAGPGSWVASDDYGIQGWRDCFGRERWLR